MKTGFGISLAAYLVAWAIDGPRGVIVLAGLGICGTAVMFTADALHHWRRTRDARRIAYRRWRAWEFDDQLRRRFGWRRPR